jgi:hypothetical protein
MPKHIVTQEIVNQWSKIADTIIEGDLKDVTDLACPYCNAKDLIFSFTIKKTPFYGLYVFCKTCEGGQHFTLKDRPRNFRDDLVLEKFQRMEGELGKQSRSNIE